MDTLTHAIIGAAIARATAPESRHTERLPVKHRLITGALVAAFPDVDSITALIHPLAFIADWHRSITHSFIMLPIWAVLLGFVLSKFYGNGKYKNELTIICSFPALFCDIILAYGLGLHFQYRLNPDIYNEQHKPHPCGDA